MPSNPDYVPDSILAAVEHIFGGLNSAERDTIALAPADANHFGGGMHMRNDWSMWEDETPLKRDAVENYRIAHADDLSGLISEWVWAKAKGEEFDPLEHCEQYHRHWRGYGMSALQAGGYNDDGSVMTAEQRKIAQARAHRITPQ